MTVLEVDVVKAVPAEVAPAYVRRVLLRASRVPEMAARLPVGAADVAVRITSSAELRELNRTFAGEDHATDVLSFAGAGDHLGDIAISWPKVEAQAAAAGHGPKQELAVLLVHGFLHLLGWDHRTRKERDEMWRLAHLALGTHRSGYTRRDGLRHSPRA